jgi:SAM-dependent methyltransferase
MFASMLRTQEEEILDHEGLSRRGRSILQDLDRWNRASGWYTAHTRRVRRHWEALGRPSPFRVLDIGTGSGGLLAALADTDMPCELVGVDKSPAFVEIAAQRLGTRATVLEADATALPFPDQSFHLATNTLMMHHLPHGVRHALIREVARVARSAYVFDLEVTLYGVVGFAFLAPLVGLGRDAVHDGMLSVRRGATFAEMRGLMKPLPVKVVRVFPSALCTMPA